VREQFSEMDLNVWSVIGRSGFVWLRVGIIYESVSEHGAEKNILSKGKKKKKKRRKLHNEDLYNLFYATNIVREIS
jgi:hypothetical protein